MKVLLNALIVGILFAAPIQLQAIAQPENVAPSVVHRGEVFSDAPTMAKVEKYAGKKELTISVIDGVTFVEMAHSDVFGVGMTLELAAQDFMGVTTLNTDTLAQPKVKNKKKLKGAPTEEPPIVPVFPRNPLPVDQI